MRSLTWFNLNDRLTVTGTSVGITNDNRGSIATYTNESVVAISDDGKTFEMMQINAAAGVMTIIKRGLDNSSVKTEVPGLKKERGPNTKIFITALASDFVASNTVNTWTAKQIFGDVDITGILNLLALGDVNVTGKSNPQPNFATTAERDLFYTAPVNGDKCTVDGVDYSYNGSTAQWEAKGVSTPLPKATETVEGKMALATLAEVLAGIVADKAVTPATLAGKSSDSLITISKYPLGEPIITLANSSVFKESGPTFAQAANIANIGDSAANTRFEIPIFGNGNPMSSVNLGLKKFISPSVDLKLRFENNFQETRVVTPITGTFIASASSINGTDNPYKAFDGNVGTSWIATIGSIGWLRIQLPSAVKLYKYDVVAEVGTSSPNTWTFEGSNDGTSWNTLDTQTGQTFSSGQTKSYSYTPTVPYLYYRINVTTKNVNLVIAELKLYRELADGFQLSNNMLGFMTGDTTVGSSADVEGNYIYNSPSGVIYPGTTETVISTSGLTTSIVDKSISLAQSITIGKGILVWAVLYPGTYGSETLNPSNYFGIAYYTNNTTTRGRKLRNGSDHSSQNKTIRPYIAGNGIENKVLSLTDAKFSYKLPDVLRFCIDLLSAGSYPKLLIYGLNKNFIGMGNAISTQYISNTPGGVSNTAGTNSYIVGKNIEDDQLWVRDIIS